VERSVPQQNDAIRLVRRATRLVTWVALPLGATALLRAFPALPLAGSGAGSSEVWPLVAALAAAGSALAMLAWLFRAARTMPAPLAPLLVVAAAGALTAGWIVAALDEPARSSAEGAPPPAVAVALLAAAIPLAVAAVVGDRRLGRREAVVATAVVVLVWIEAAPAAGLFGADALRGLVPAIAAGAAVVLLLASARAAWDGSAARHAGTMRGRGQALRPGWVAGLATAAVTVVLARQGSAEALVPALTCAMAGAAASLAALGAGAPALTPPVVGPPAAPATLQAPAEPTHDSAAAHRRDAADEATQLARELRDALAQLLASRETVRLQRAELERLAMTDAGTGVLARGAVLDRMRIEVAEARRYAHPVVALLLAVDGLAGLNRAQGLASGDAVLREVALRLRVRVRAADALGRTSGDTFLALLPHADERGAAIFAEALRERIAGQPVETPAGPVTVTASIGISLMRAGTELTVDELLGRAEEALRSAQAGGGNRIAYDRLHGLARLEPPHPPAPDHAGAGQA
jgi:diguanylate cyclase (GGDEF)-like protein